MASEHEHIWVYVTNVASTRLARYCKLCDVQQLLTPNELADSLQTENARLQADNATMRALLEEVVDFESYDDYSIEPLQEKISAYLADHPQK